MSKAEEFLEFWNYLTTEVAGEIEIPVNVQAYIDAIKSDKVSEKPAFTDNGKAILVFLQGQSHSGMFKAKDIAEGMGITSKTVSGAMRKLTTDGYVEKVGSNPVVYTITEKGINVNFEGDNEKNEAEFD